MKLRSVARRIDGAGRVEVHEPRRSHYVASDGTYTSVPNGTRRIAPEGSVRVVVWSADPESVLSMVGEQLQLKPEPQVARDPVNRRKVHDFLDAVMANPTAYTESFIHTQLDAWGRDAVQHLRPENLMIAAHRQYDYAAYMRRYLTDDTTLNTSSVLRFGRKERPGWDAVGLYGWPLEGSVPTQAEIFMSAGMELVADWRWKEFVERVTDGMRTGEIIMTSPERTARLPHEKKVQRMAITAEGVVKGGFNLPYAAPVRIRARTNRRRACDSFEMILRAGAALGASFTNAGSFKSTDPSWWYLHVDPMSYRGAELYLKRIHDTMWDDKRAVRFVSPTRFMRVQNGLIIAIAAAELSPSAMTPHGAPSSTSASP